MTERDLLVLGDVNPDVIVSGVGDQVQFGQAEQLVDGASLVLGGSAAITATGAARLGLAVGVCAVVGDDAPGRFVVDRLGEGGVSSDHLRRDPATPTGMSVILDRGADRAILTAPGTIPLLAAADLEALPDRPARHVHVASYYLMSPGYRAALPEALRRFRRAGVTTSLDPNWDPSGEWDLTEVLTEVDVFLPNLAELRALADERPVGCDVVVKLGAEGALARSGGREHRVAARPPGSYVDAVGAGDSFDAGYLAGMLSGLDTAGSMRLAVAVGTLSTRAAGGTSAQPDRPEADAWAQTLQVTVGPVASR